MITVPDVSRVASRDPNFRSRGSRCNGSGISRTSFPESCRGSLLAKKREILQIGDYRRSGNRLGDWPEVSALQSEGRRELLRKCPNQKHSIQFKPSSGRNPQNAGAGSAAVQRITWFSSGECGASSITFACSSRTRSSKSPGPTLTLGDYRGVIHAVHQLGSVLP